VAVAAAATSAAEPAVGDRVRVWTEPAPASADARTGVDGAISVDKLLVR
jgi:hypothetical protein